MSFSTIYAQWLSSTWCAPWMCVVRGITYSLLMWPNLWHCKQCLVFGIKGKPYTSQNPLWLPLIIICPGRWVSGIQIPNIVIWKDNKSLNIVALKPLFQFFSQISGAFPWSYNAFANVKETMRFDLNISAKQFQGLKNWIWLDKSLNQ